MRIICWKSSYTGKTGRGKTKLDDSSAEQWVARLNAQFPGINHWAEPA